MDKELESSITHHQSPDSCLSVDEEAANQACGAALDTDFEVASQFCALPKTPERKLDHSVSDHRARLIRRIEKKWVNGTTLRYYFFTEPPLSADKVQKDIVRKAFQRWADVGMGIQFQEVAQISEAEIRIGFQSGDGAWSYVGRDILDIPGQHERTMNFGWDLARDPNGLDTAVHEIGHTLGFPHEHQNPFAGIVWDEEAVYRYFAQPPNRWSRGTTDHNVLRKLEASEVDGSQWDPDSIMHYAFAPGLIQAPEQYAKGLKPAPGLSEIDRQEVRTFYPPLDDVQSPQLLLPYQSVELDLAPAEQRNFEISPERTGVHQIQTFGDSDTLMVLFEDVDGELRYLAADDDSGTDLNASLSVRLRIGRRYVLRIRLYSQYASGQTAVMIW